MPIKGQWGQVIALHSIKMKTKNPPPNQKETTKITGATKQTKIVIPVPMPAFGVSGSSGSFGSMTQGNYIMRNGCCRAQPPNPVIGIRAYPGLQ